MPTENKIYFYPVWLRVWHGLNAIGIICLIVTGISMQSIESSFMDFNFAVKMHNLAGVLVAFSYLIFVIGNLITNNSQFYIIKPKGFLKRPLKQAYYYAWGMFHGMKSPYPLSEKRKFNPLQKYSYVVVMYFALPAVIITGFGLLFPEIIVNEVYRFSGVFVTAVFHSALGFFISFFLLIHIYVSTIGKNPLDNFKSIVNGWHHF